MRWGGFRTIPSQEPITNLAFSIGAVLQLYLDEPWSHWRENYTSCGKRIKVSLNVFFFFFLAIDFFPRKGDVLWLGGIASFVCSILLSKIFMPFMRDLTESCYIAQKNENRQGIIFARARSVRETLMPISEITMYGRGNIQRWRNSVCLISNKSRKHLKRLGHGILSYFDHRQNYH